MNEEYQELEEAPTSIKMPVGGGYNSAWKKNRLLGTASDVIDAFGGTKALADILGVRPSAVSNYRKLGFPAKAYYQLAQMARQRGLNVAGIVFGGIIPETTRPPKMATNIEETTKITPRDFFASKGFDEIETAILQPAAPYINLLGEEMQNRLYRFTDPAGEQLCLRPDLTVPTALAYIASGKKTRSLFSYEGVAFRYQRRQQTKDGKAREFIQTGIEILGDSKYPAEDNALVLGTILAVIDQAGLSDYKIKVNDFRVFPFAVMAMELGEKLTQRLIRHYYRGRDMEKLLDSWDAGVRGGESASDEKESDEKESDERESDDKGADDKGADDKGIDKNILTAGQKQQLQKLLSLRGTPESVLMGALMIIDSSPVHEFFAFDGYWKNLAGAIGILPENLQFDMTQGRKMSYYTGINFEIYAPQLGNNKPIAVGGRYDNLLRGLGAKQDIAAVGGVIFLDRLEEALSLQGENLS
ncbi:MAG: hypothetical protein HAW64_00900 [Alphaproteobacteria bacterium]|nr:hypothetical protein [Alphaproteobacteria bacterium]